MIAGCVQRAGAALLAVLAAGTAWDGPRSAAASVEPAGPRLLFQGDPNVAAFGTVLVSGLDARALEALARRPAEWDGLLRVYTGETLPGDPSIPPILGTTSIDAEGIRFTPRFPLATGLRFYARFDGALFGALTGSGAARPPLELVFSMPVPATGPTARVEAVHPSARVVPENLLRAYVHFSAPMREQSVSGKVRILDDRGAPVPMTFVEVPGGLWDRDQRRLTLLFHPGRIKRGVGPHESLGTPLRAGVRYRLEVSAGLLDAQGFPLAEPYGIDYVAGAADRTSPDPSVWRLTPPADGRSPIVLDLNEPMDHAFMLRLVGVQDEHGVFVRGAAALSGAETRWAFTPAEPWRPGRYSVVIDPALEDLAGNTPHRLFDEGPGDRAETGAAAREPIRLHFAAGMAAAPLP